MSSSVPADNIDPGGLETFRGSDDLGETTSFSCVIDNAGNEWQFPPIPATQLPKLSRMGHWRTAEEFFSGQPPVQVSLWAGEEKLRHVTLDGRELGMSVRLGEHGEGKRYVVHYDAEGQQIAILSIIRAEPERQSLIGRLLFKNSISLTTRVRYELRTANGSESVKLSLAHSKAGRYLRYKGFATPGAS